MTTAHKWQFASRFRRDAFGWRSDLPIKRIKEALSEINKVARADPVLAANGAVGLLQKLSPALQQVDSSSGALGAAVNHAIDTLVPIIASANVEAKTRERWLEKLWEALEDDEIPYLEHLSDYWGELCASAERSSQWANDLKPTVERVYNPTNKGYGFFKGTTACFSCLYAAGRYQELLTLLELPRLDWWPYRRWGFKSLVAMGKKEEALLYAENSGGLNAPHWQIAQACEGLLLSMGREQEAYERYAIESNLGTTHLSRFRAISKKYPGVSAEKILRDLAASMPGDEGKWFASAKHAGLFKLAIELVSTSPTDPRTLTRAARDFAEKEPGFAFQSGAAALHWIAAGYGYEITGLDVSEACAAMAQAALNAGASKENAANLLQTVSSNLRGPNTEFVREVLARRRL